MTRSLPAVDSSSEIAEFMRDEIAKTYAGLERFQDPEKGLWHLVMDEALTPVETSASGAIIYCYERLHEWGMIERKHDAMIERAFAGMKRLYYRGGFAGCCRGTGFGVPHYYRSRPMGYFNSSLGLAAMATRREVDSRS
jgi:rhamnogalacturonyl hydrolase YesR